ncbi:hypothetical protein EUGRSUZ_B01331 [Eucalyptus grandis]|uniref:XPG N-terminal domain-containing protein n=2 Tax=Eucalyptus grandis TaxID=71139 RepID=A0A059D1A2_EUCGR|nr:hypothetical protein EUGRSUZ_B01331 [Eucalyptus grandis]
MGIKGLTKLLADNAPNAMKERKLESYFGRRIAVDASMTIYQFLVVVGRKGTQMLTNEAGEVTSHLQGMFYRTIRLLEAGKMSSFSLTHACSLVYAIASEDMDSLTFGAPIFLRHIMDPSSRKILEEMNLDMDQFIDLCILSGCDYCESIRGIGGLTALKLIRQHGSIENILEKINKQRYQIPDNWPYSEARLLLKEPIVSKEEQPEIKWTAPNEEERAYMFSMLFYHVYRAIEKIKAAKDELESFFKPAQNLSVPAKRKGSKCTLQSPNLAIKPKTFSTQVAVNPQPRFRGSFEMPTMVLGLRNFKQPLRIVCLLTWI